MAEIKIPEPKHKSAERVTIDMIEEERTDDDTVRTFRPSSVTRRKYVYFEPTFAVHDI
tara:strand:+ start:234 stop:407 length:174 start_codon:yes stop_codon:yes gene_type:complete